MAQAFMRRVHSDDACVTAKVTLRGVRSTFQIADEIFHLGSSRVTDLSDPYLWNWRIHERGEHAENLT